MAVCVLACMLVGAQQLRARWQSMLYSQLCSMVWYTYVLHLLLACNSTPDAEMLNCFAAGGKQE